MPTKNTPVDSGINKSSSNPAIASDGTGGFYITWMRGHVGIYGTEIYAQRISASGQRLWPSPVVICNAVNFQYWPKIIEDGAGGAIITWQDQRGGFSNWDVYAQRINADGSVAWANNGVAVLNDFRDELGPEMIADGSGGAIITAWRSASGGLQTDIVAQRINHQGNIQWASNGVMVCNAINRQDIPKIVSDGTGGAIISWQDFRNNATVADVYAQRINSAGANVWASNGIAVCTIAYDQIQIRLESDNTGGAYLAWQDFRNSSPSANETDIFVQHIDGGGNSLWTAGGVAVCTSTGIQAVPNMATDKLNNVIIGWSDFRNNGSSIYVQKLSAAGTVVWNNNGVPVVSRPTTFDIGAPFIMADTSNGFYFFWSQGTSPNIDIFKQHVAANGTMSWTTNGIAVSTAPDAQIISSLDNQLLNGDVIADGKGGAVVVWQDNRHTADYADIYISLASIIPPPKPIVLQVNDKCTHSASAKGKVDNPPTGAGVQVLVDGTAVPYNAADSSFTYFLNGVTPAGNHTVSVKFLAAGGNSQTDSVYKVTATAIPQVNISGSIMVNQGQTTTVTATIINGGSSPIITWQDSTALHNWQVIAGAANSSIFYQPRKDGDKLQALLSSNASCAVPVNVVSNILSFQVKDTGITVANPVFIRLYPNPAWDILFVDGLDAASQWKYAWIYSADGKQMTTTIALAGQSKVAIDVSRFASGGYILALHGNNHDPLYYRFIKITR